MAGRPFHPGIAALAVLLSASAAAAQPFQFPSRDVRIDVRLPDPRTAQVVETYLVDRTASDAAFELLDVPCSSVGPVSVAVAGRQLPIGRSQRGPWTMLHAARLDGGAVQVRYRVALGGVEAAVPIVLPAAPLEPVGELRGSDVVVRVAFGDGVAGGAVVLPRLERGADGVWQGHFLAIPSRIALHLPGDRLASCASALPGTSGGLAWRFWLFVATMAVWIPIYFWFFSRGDEAE